MKTNKTPYIWDMLSEKSKQCVHVTQLTTIYNMYRTKIKSKYKNGY